MPLMSIIHQINYVFCNGQKQVEELQGELQGRGYMAAGLHGDETGFKRSNFKKF